VGIYQFVAISVLTPFGFARTDVVAYILLFQAMTYGVLLVWGTIGLGTQRKPAVSQVSPEMTLVPESGTSVPR
jgi:uncharacterized membrane protein YbhN (UPF0104 family)